MDRKTIVLGLLILSSSGQLFGREPILTPEPILVANAPASNEYSWFQSSYYDTRDEAVKEFNERKPKIEKLYTLLETGVGETDWVDGTRRYWFVFKFLNRGTGKIPYKWSQSSYFDTLDVARTEFNERKPKVAALYPLLEARLGETSWADGTRRYWYVFKYLELPSVALPGLPQSSPCKVPASNNNLKAIEETIACLERQVAVLQDAAFIAPTLEAREEAADEISIITPNLLDMRLRLAHLKAAQHRMRFP